jgi:hypothetical protein
MIDSMPSWLVLLFASVGILAGVAMLLGTVRFFGLGENQRTPENPAAGIHDHGRPPQP